MFDPSSYTIASHLFVRLLGFIYFFAFGAFLFQIKGLIGKNGILPLEACLREIRSAYPKNYYLLAPMVFWLNCSDDALKGVVAAGTAAAVLLMFGVYPPVMLFLLYILYLSIVVAGQDFLAFGWEGFLLEVTVNAFFLSLTDIPNIMVWISINLLLFRFHIQSGAVKIQSKDKNWRNLTAIAYHYLSQPIPNSVAWYAHKLPMWFQKLSTLLMFIVELAVPFGIFGPDWMRLGVFFCFFGLQWTIWATGNFSFLNHLTAVFSVILIANVYLEGWFSAPSISPPSDITMWPCTLAGTVLAALQLIQLYTHFVPKVDLLKFLRPFSRFFLINRYGIFAIMTTGRREVIFEGSDDGVEWKEYAFYHKPSEVDRRPRRISPYQPRIDWQAWFLPLGGGRHEAWMQLFMYHLLKGTPDVTALVRVNPFKDHPPKYVRAALYDYAFTTFKEKKETGNWWKRRFLGLFAPSMMLKDKGT